MLNDFWLKLVGQTRLDEKQYFLPLICLINTDLQEQIRIFQYPMIDFFIFSNSSTYYVRMIVY